MASIWEYLRTVADHWFFWFGGIMLVILELINKKYGERAKKYVSQWVFWSIAGLCVFIATFQSWHDERDQKESANNALGALKNNREPHLSLHIDMTSVGTLTSKTDESNIFMWASITNTGYPSIADEWDLTVLMSGSDSSLHAIDVGIDPSKTIEFSHINGTDDAETLSANDFLYDKAFKTPVPTNGRIRGFMMFLLPGVPRDAIRRAGTIFTLRCKDVLGNPVSASYTWQGKKPDNPTIFPGMNYPLKYKTKQP